MKKLILLLSILLLVGCSSNQNMGYGYNTKTSTPVQVDTNSSGYHQPQEKKSWWERAAETANAQYMDLYDVNGNETVYSIRAFKGTYDGHVFYVFKMGDQFCVVPMSIVVN